MLKDGCRNGYEQRQGGPLKSSTLSLLNTGGFGRESTAGSPASALSRKGTENYFKV